MKEKWVVHKFGGTSMADAVRIQSVAKLVLADESSPRAVVVSAMSKVTDSLIELVELAKKQSDTYLARLEVLKKRHSDTVQALVPPGSQKQLISILESDFEDIKEILRGVWLLRTYSERIVELVSGYGEIWSAQFLNAYLLSLGRESVYLDARKVLVVEPGETQVQIDWKISKEKSSAWVSKNPTQLMIITGFVAATHEGIATTLKRNGSDFSASIFGALLEASEINIWTDVDGVLSADPRLVPDAVVVEELSYSEATELAYFGAKVVHPSTMAPAIRDEIPIWIKNTFNPNAKGTKICAKPQAGPHGSAMVKGFATVDDIALINVEGTGMIGVPGVAERLFRALKEVNVSVVMISQASSEQSICFAIPRKQAELAKTTLEKTFFAEIHQGQIQTVQVTDHCSILAIVGDGMVERPGVSGEFFTALGRVGVNIRGIAQGSSERNISAVIASQDSKRALRAVHSAFYLSNQTISIGLIGPGLIGGTFLNQLKVQIQRLKTERHIDLRVRGIMDSKHMILDEQAIDLECWNEKLKASAEPANLEKFAAHVRTDYLPHSVLIDATSNAEITQNYPQWLKQGLHIITPNKKANTGTLKFYRELKEAARTSKRHYLYHTTVGAGLPIIHTLQDLVHTGDQISQIEGVFSGTLSYIFNSFSPEKPFSSIVIDARAKGYTEPDPRDDLSGMDVARKLVILAREMGLALELSEIEVENLVPEEIRSGDIASYLKELPKFDSKMSKLVADAQAKGEVLRYVGTVLSGSSSSKPKARVELKRFSKQHPFANTTGSDNIVAFRTTHYDQQPLIVQGPGAGPGVTAAGVFADLLRLASYLGASL
jgi:aspartokinase/homoserine dehydrogenase 1